MNKRQRKKALKKLQAITRRYFIPVYVNAINNPGARRLTDVLSEAKAGR